MAYELGRTDQIVGPGWTNSERFDIEAIASSEAPASVSPGTVALMLRALLEDRFDLRIRIDSDESPVYVLVRANSDGFGPRLRRTDIDCAALLERAATARPATGARSCSEKVGPGVISYRGRTIQRLAEHLSTMVDRRVVDRTGLEGDFDLDLEWAADLTARPLADPAIGTREERPSLSAAVQEQLGLRLQSRREPLPVLVVERVTRPTEN